jgi:hypothetical protein
METELSVWRRIRAALLLVWIAGTALFFFLRFSLIFYSANSAAIRAALGRFFP